MTEYERPFGFGKLVAAADLGRVGSIFDGFRGFGYCQILKLQGRVG